MDRAASLVAAFDDARGAIDGLRPAGASSDVEAVLSTATLVAVSEAAVDQGVRRRFAVSEAAKRRGPRLKQTARQSSGPPALKNGDRVEADFDGGGDYHSKVKFTGLAQNSQVDPAV